MEPSPHQYKNTDQILQIVDYENVDDMASPDDLTKIYKQQATILQNMVRL